MRLLVGHVVLAALTVWKALVPLEDVRDVVLGLVRRARREE